MYTIIWATIAPKKLTGGDLEPDCKVKVKLQTFNTSKLTSNMNIKASEASADSYLIPWMFLMA